MLFNKKYQLLLERYKKKPKIWYHGTSFNNLRGILKQGLVTNPNKKEWGAEIQPTRLNPVTASLDNSIYFSSSLETAMVAGDSAMENDDTTKYLIVVAQMDLNNFFADEDSLLSIFPQPAYGTVDLLEEKIQAFLEKGKQYETDVANWWFESQANSFSPDDLNVAEDMKYDIYNSFLYRQAAHDLHCRGLLGLDESTEFYEKETRKLMDKLSRRLKHIIRKESSEDGRVVQNIGYKGNKKIICIFDIDMNASHATIHYGYIPLRTHKKLRSVGLTISTNNK